MNLYGLRTEQENGFLVTRKSFEVEDYDLGATLSSGQVFRWRRTQGGWTGLGGDYWVHLRENGRTITGETAEPVADWTWLTDYLQADLDLNEVTLSFPEDESMRAAVTACRGLRLLRQDPWECLASFICSSTKQIAQIRQIVLLLCKRWGDPVDVPSGTAPVFAFPPAARIAEAHENDLRACKAGFRAGYLSRTARRIQSGEFALDRLGSLPVSEARAHLMTLPGVGRKIADCVLLFAFGFPNAFPVDIWVMKALRQLYFPRRRVSMQHMHRFAATHFGPWAGYAQQYLFHYMRTCQPTKVKMK